MNSHLFLQTDIAEGRASARLFDVTETVQAGIGRPETKKEKNDPASGIIIQEESQLTHHLKCSGFPPTTNRKEFIYEC